MTFNEWWFEQVMVKGHQIDVVKNDENITVVNTITGEEFAFMDKSKVDLIMRDICEMDEVDPNAVCVDYNKLYNLIIRHSQGGDIACTHSK